MKRREALKSLSLLAAVNLPVVSFARPPQPRKPKFVPVATDTLLAQSGVYGQGVFVVGVLRCSNPSAVDKRLEALRKETSYRLTLSHRSKTKYKAPYFEAAIDDWLAHDEVKIYLRVVIHCRAETLELRRRPNQRHGDGNGDSICGWKNHHLATLQ